MKIIIKAEELADLVLEVQDQHETLNICKNWFGEYIVVRQTEKEETNVKPQGRII